MGRCVDRILAEPLQTMLICQVRRRTHLLDDAGAVRLSWLPMRIPLADHASTIG